MSGRDGTTVFMNIGHLWLPKILSCLRMHDIKLVDNPSRTRGGVGISPLTEAVGGFWSFFFKAVAPSRSTMLQYMAPRPQVDRQQELGWMGYQMGWVTL